MSEVPEKDDDVVLAGEYALGLLSATEAAAFETRLGAEPELRALYAQWAEDFAVLADEIPEEAPPARVKAALDRRLFADERPARRGLFERFGLTGLAAAALVVALFFVVDLPGSGVQPPESPVYHADLRAEGEEEIILAAGYDATTQEMYVERRGMQDRPDRDIEMWLIAGDNPPVSLGVLPENERLRLPMTPEQIEVLQGATLAISDEPEGGSPTGAPTGDILATGPLEDV
ncbi:anti-sigma factor [Roseovarius sp. SK2]|uniref:anti-sigma factor n=1 Tax=Roseovarius TaxID=74030 RepID=UPI00237B5A33|nr:anti-sigma factor [Roseovarius sp. SK2]MDD9724256.1 anti-sigma factor [Roseovarius sp. SK2]